MLSVIVAQETPNLLAGERNLQHVPLVDYCDTIDRQLGPNELYLFSSVMSKLNGLRFVAELADALVLETSAAWRAGATPVEATTETITLKLWVDKFNFGSDAKSQCTNFVSMAPYSKSRELGLRNRDSVVATTTGATRNSSHSDYLSVI